MSLVFLASLLVGLLLAVRAMITGVERPAPDSAPSPSPNAPPRVSLGAFGLAAFLTVFGIVGYLLLRYSGRGAALVLVAAAVAGALALVGAVMLVTRWAVPSAMEDQEDPRYLLQGTPARVTRDIGHDAVGEISFVAEGRQQTAMARSFDGEPLEAGTEVVIDRVEDGVAYVEAWAVVEKRL